MANTYTLISSNVLSTTAASVTFSAIPATYTDLIIRASIRTNNAAVDDSLLITANGTSTQYSSTYLRGSGSAATSARATSDDYFRYPSVVGNNATSNTFSNTEIYFPNYAGSANKVIASFSVAETNATAANMDVVAGLIRNTSAITEIIIDQPSGNSFLSGSSFYLYGIKNS
jgi:hypothetical protein